MERGLHQQTSELDSLRYKPLFVGVSLVKYFSGSYTLHRHLLGPLFKVD